MTKLYVLLIILFIFDVTINSYPTCLHLYWLPYSYLIDYNINLSLITNSYLTDYHFHISHWLPQMYESHLLISSITDVSL